MAAPHAERVKLPYIAVKGTLAFSLVVTKYLRLYQLNEMCKGVWKYNDDADARTTHLTALPL